MRRNLRLWLILSLTLLMVLAACETTRQDTSTTPEGEDGVAAQTDGATTPGAEGEGAEGETATDGSATDGTATDGTATDGTATDGTATDGTASGESTEVAVDDAGTGDSAEGEAAEGEGAEGEASSSEVYVVQAGDTLQSIADQYGTTVDELRASNNLESDFLTVGQELTVGGAAAADGEVEAAADGGEGAEAEQTDAGQESAEASQGGEEAAQTGEAVTTDESGTANQGQQGGQRIHVVQPGEWVYSIARIYNVSPQSIIQANPSLRGNPNYVRPGQELIIP